MAKKFKYGKTFWGIALLFVAGGLEAIGVTGVFGYIQTLAGLIGLPLVGIGAAHKLDKLSK